MAAEAGYGPDQFGNAVIRRYFEEQGRPDAALSPLQRLLYIGDRAMGALEFHPPLDPGPGTDEALEVRHLVDQARRVIEGDVSAAVPEIMQVGGSAGGARPKALILWDRAGNRVRSGFARPEPGEEPWLVKFDGVTSEAAGQGMRAARNPGPWGRIEYAYSCMACDAGIEIPETHLLRDGDLAHFMVRRFDRSPAKGTDPPRRLHFHSLGGLQHIDFNDQYVFSYEGWFDTMRAIGLGQRSVNEAFRRMVFAVATVNFDGAAGRSSGKWRRPSRRGGGMLGRRECRMRWWNGWVGVCGRWRRRIALSGWTRRGDIIMISKRYHRTPTEVEGCPTWPFGESRTTCTENSRRQPRETTAASTARSSRGSPPRSAPRRSIPWRSWTAFSAATAPWAPSTWTT